MCSDTFILIVLGPQMLELVSRLDTRDKNDSYFSDLSNIPSCPHLELYKNDFAWTEALVCIPVDWIPVVKAGIEVAD